MKFRWLESSWEVYKRDRCTCVYCGFSGLNAFDCWRQLALDHLVPVCKKGYDKPDNKVVACHRCNTMKGSFDPSGGDAPAVLDDRKRSEYIEIVKRELNLDGCEDRKDFDEMMNEIKQKAAAA